MTTDHADMLDLVQVGICAIDEAYRIFIWNRCLAQWSGRSAAEMIGTDVRDYVPELTKPLYTMRLENIFSGGPPVIFSSHLHGRLFPLYLPDGKMRIQHIIVSGMDTGGYERSRAMFLVEDVTELTRQIENSRRARQELERVTNIAVAANRAKSDFIGRMSHEIRTPMNAVLGFTEILKEQLTDPGHLEMLTCIDSSGRTLLELINDLLDLSRIDAGKMEIKPEPVDPAALVEDVRSMFFHKAMEKGLEFQVEWISVIPPQLLLDQLRLRQVLINLVGNAVKFTHKGRVRLCLEAETRASDALDLTVTVEDTGIGIATADQQSVFEPFSQRHRDTNQYGGTGLGLAITRQLVRMMDGSITVDSKPGRGSVFTVRLPGIAPGPAAGSGRAAPDLSERSFGGVQVLIADSDEKCRHLFSSILQRAGIETLQAESGAEAVTLAGEYSPDLLIIDTGLADMDYLQAVRQIRKDGSQKPVILLSTDSRPAFADQEERDLCSVLLEKPLSGDELMAEVSRLLPGTGAGSDAVPPGAAVRIPRELHDRLRGGLMTSWESVNRTFIIGSIEAFIAETGALAEEYDFDPLKEWHALAAGALKRFDVEELKRVLSRFPALTSGFTC